MKHKILKLIINLNVMKQNTEQKYMERNTDKAITDEVTGISN
jgi:hypothetical protein